MSNIEVRYFACRELLCRTVYFKKDRIPFFDIRLARNALKLVRGKFNNFIHNSRFTLPQRTFRIQISLS